MAKVRTIISPQPLSRVFKPWHSKCFYSLLCKTSVRPSLDWSTRSLFGLLGKKSEDCLRSPRSDSESYRSPIGLGRTGYSEFGMGSCQILSENSLRTVLGVRVVRSDSDRIRWGSVKTSI